MALAGEATALEVTDPNVKTYERTGRTFVRSASDGYRERYSGAMHAVRYPGCVARHFADRPSSSYFNGCEESVSVDGQPVVAVLRSQGETIKVLFDRDGYIEFAVNSTGQRIEAGDPVVGEWRNRWGAEPIFWEPQRERSQSPGFMIVGDSIWALQGREEWRNTGFILNYVFYSAEGPRWFNAAIGGNTTRSCLRSLNENISAETEVVFVACGTNDGAISELSEWTTAISLIQIAARAKAEGARSVIVDHIDDALDPRRRQWAAYVNEALDSIDMPTVFSVASIQRDLGWAGEDYPDGLHPSEEQGELMLLHLLREVIEW